MRWVVLYLRSRRIAAGAGTALAAMAGPGMWAQQSPPAHPTTQRYMTPVRASQEHVGTVHPYPEWFLACASTNSFSRTSSRSADMKSPKSRAIVARP